MMLKKIVIALMMGISIGHGPLTATKIQTESRNPLINENRIILQRAFNEGQLSMDEIESKFMFYLNEKSGMMVNKEENHMLKEGAFESLIKEWSSLSSEDLFKELSVAKEKYPEKKEFAILDEKIRNLYVQMKKFT